MTYFQFIHAVETKVKKEVEEEKTVSIHTNVKNNGVRRSGIMISEKGINISPTIYLEEYFHQFRMGYPLEQIAKDIVGLYEKIRFQNSWEDGEKVKDYEFVKDKIIYRLIGREENQELLKEIPYKSYLDLAIIYYSIILFDCRVIHYHFPPLMCRNPFPQTSDLFLTSPTDTFRSCGTCHVLHQGICPQ